MMVLRDTIEQHSKFYRHGIFYYCRVANCNTVVVKQSALDQLLCQMGNENIFPDNRIARTRDRHLSVFCAYCIVVFDTLSLLQIWRAERIDKIYFDQ